MRMEMKHEDIGAVVISECASGPPLYLGAGVDGVYEPAPWWSDKAEEGSGKGQICAEEHLQPAAEDPFAL